jgi:integrase
MTLNTDMLSTRTEPKKLLTDAAIRGLRPAAKPFKVTAGQGLRLTVQPNGSKLWRWKYYWEGREKQMSFGAYPEVGLKEARDRRDDARRILRMGYDPILHPAGATSVEIATARIVAGERTFQDVADEWYQVNRPGWAPGYTQNLENWLHQKIYPVLGQRSLSAIDTAEVMGLVRRLEDKGIAQTGRRVCKTIEAVYDYARALRYCDHNPAAGLAKAKVFKRVETTPQLALTTLPEITALLRATEQVETKGLFKLALRFLALTAARPRLVREMTWDEVEDLEGNRPVWRVPGKRMKMREDWVSPLSGPALDILRTMRELRTDEGPDYVFPHWSRAKAEKPISETSMADLIQAAGFTDRHCPHGFRSSFSTVMSDRPDARPFDDLVVEAQLAHKLPGVKGIYNRGTYLNRRAELCAEWAGMIIPPSAPTAQQLLMGN